MMDRVGALYEPLVAAARSRLAADAGLRKVVDPGTDALLVERYLVQFTSMAVQMTEPVEGWIRRAGERCIEVGLEDVGKSLCQHAHHEAGHHLMLIADTRHLVAHWNARHPDQLDADALLSQPATAATRAYVDLHETTIAGPAPAGQVAIEYEIEHMSTVIGPPQIAQFGRVLGGEIMAGLSFLKEHVEIDVGHTALNKKMLERLLDHDPGMAEMLGRLGSKALNTYVDFLDDCLAGAELALRGN